MSGKSLTLLVLGTLCVGAAAAGGYVALRMNAADRDRATSGAPAATVAPALDQPPAPQPAAEVPAESRTTVPRTPAGGGARPPVTAHPAPPVSNPGAPVESKAPTSAAPGAADPSVAPPLQAAPPPPAAPPVAGTDTGAPVTQSATDPTSPLPNPAKALEEITIKEDSVIGIRLETAVTSSTAKVEDRVDARVARDVMVDGRPAVPAGTRLEGTVTQVQRGGKFKERAHLGIRFDTLILADGTRVPLRTAPIFREGEPPTGEATSKIGASAVVGAILGVVIGGKKGAIIGGTAGAAGGAAAVAAGDANEATLPAGALLTVRLTAPVTLAIDRAPTPQT